MGKIMYEHELSGKVITEEEYYQRIDECVKVLDNDIDCFKEWLRNDEEDYKNLDSNPMKKKILLQRFHEDNFNNVREDMEDMWVEVEIEEDDYEEE